MEVEVQHVAASHPRNDCWSDWSTGQAIIPSSGDAPGGLRSLAALQDELGWVPDALRRSEKYVKIVDRCIETQSCWQFKEGWVVLCVFHFPVAYIERVDRNKMPGYRKLQLFVNSSTSKSRFFRMSVIYIIFGFFLNHVFRCCSWLWSHQCLMRIHCCLTPLRWGLWSLGCLATNKEELCPTRWAWQSNGLAWLDVWIIVDGLSLLIYRSCMLLCLCPFRMWFPTKDGGTRLPMAFYQAGKPQVYGKAQLQSCTSIILLPRPAGCKCFDFASTKGLRAYLHKRKASCLVAIAIRLGSRRWILARSIENYRRM